MQHSPSTAARTRFRMRGVLLVVAVNVAVAAMLLSVLEGVLVLMLNHPPPVHLVLRALSGYYHEADRPILQFMPECAIYDTTLGYTLKPGRCRFQAREFDTTVEINSVGLRDDEASLWSPQIIVLGDSFAMGWGVEGHESFPSLLESQCRKRVLNAAVSSYGTARQLEMLRRLDLSAVEWLVVQYSDNDHGENAVFAASGDRLNPISRQEYEGVRDALRQERRYYPGKHVIGFLANIGQRLRTRAAPAGSLNFLPSSGGESMQPDIRAFLHVLGTAPKLPPNAQVLVLEINGSGRNDGAFISQLGRELQSRRVALPWTEVHVLDVAPQLTVDQFFRLDEHLSARGHRTLARLLMDALHCEQSEP